MWGFQFKGVWGCGLECKYLIVMRYRKEEWKKRIRRREMGRMWYIGVCVGGGDVNNDNG